MGHCRVARKLVVLLRQRSGVHIIPPPSVAQTWPTTYQIHPKCGRFRAESSGTWPMCVGFRWMFAPGGDREWAVFRGGGGWGISFGTLDRVAPATEFGPFRTPWSSPLSHAASAKVGFHNWLNSVEIALDWSISLDVGRNRPRLVDVAGCLR